MDLKFTAKEATIKPVNYKQVTVNAEGINLSDLLSEIGIANIIEAIGPDDLLNSIGQETARDYFGLVEAED
jgi:hypothetical protein